MKNTAKLSATSAAALFIFGALLACGDPMTGTTNPTTPNLGVYSAPRTAIVARRNAPLTSDISVSALIGPKGGIIKIKETGLTVQFPARALDSEVQITVTAKAGDMLAYEFQPHGLKFNANVKITQKLDKIDAGSSLANAFIGYYADPAAVDELTGKAQILEGLPISIAYSDNVVRAHVRHFSGYLVAMGCERNLH